MSKIVGFGDLMSGDFMSYVAFLVTFCPGTLCPMLHFSDFLSGDFMSGVFMAGDFMSYVAQIGGLMSGDFLSGYQNEVR